MEQSDVSEDWLVALGELVLACEEGSLPATQVLQTLRALIERMPRAAERSLDCADFDAEFEALLDAGALESAAIRLAGQSIGYMFSRAPNGYAVASAWIPDVIGEQTVKSREPASALCGAIALACARGFGPTLHERATAH